MPPFGITPAIAQICGRIERALGRCEGLGGAAEPKLRRQNQIRTVHATTAIEGNTLGLDQVTAVLEGRRVRGPAHEVREVKNALAAYEAVPTYHPHVEKDLLRAHRLLMAGLASDAGRYRRGDVGVMQGSRVAHVAPPAGRVPALMAELFAFLKSDRESPPLVKACVFHYELEFIHPFSDGNGRAGRLWQHVLLCAHSPVFASVPAETLIRAHQAEYYDVLAQCDRAGDATAFVAFMLGRIDGALGVFVDEFRPVRGDFVSRLEAAATHFGSAHFSRKGYMQLHKSLSPATASRDLRQGVEAGLLRVRGDRRTALYTFVPKGR